MRDAVENQLHVVNSFPLFFERHTAGIVDVQYNVE